MRQGHWSRGRWLQPGTPVRTLHNRCTHLDRCKVARHLDKNNWSGRQPRNRYTCNRDTARRRHRSWRSFPKRVEQNSVSLLCEPRAENGTHLSLPTEPDASIWIATATPALLGSNQRRTNQPALVKMTGRSWLASLLEDLGESIGTRPVSRRGRVLWNSVFAHFSIKG